MINTEYPIPKDARPTEEWSSGRARLAELVSPDVTVGKTVSTALGIPSPLDTDYSPVGAVDEPLLDEF